MPQIVSHSDVKAARRERVVPGGHQASLTDFLRPPEGLNDAPMAFLSESPGGRLIRTHYHALDQFHVMVSGAATLGRHDMPLYSVHFARAYTPYGPMVAGKAGMGFMSMYARRDRGANYLPECSDKLKGVKGRKPWQISDVPRFEKTNGVGLYGLPSIQNDEGLAAYAISLDAHMAVTTPDAFATDGQYILVTRGGLRYESKDYGALTLIFVKPNEPRFRIVADAGGVEALVLHFPRVRHTITEAVA